MWKKGTFSCPLRDNSHKSIVWMATTKEMFSLLLVFPDLVYVLYSNTLCCDCQSSVCVW